MTEEYFEDEYLDISNYSSPVDWNYDDEMVDPSPGDVWGSFSTDEDFLDGLDEDIQGMETFIEFEEMSEDEVSKLRNHLNQLSKSSKFDFQGFRNAVRRAVDLNNFELARIGILGILKGLVKPSREKSSYLGKLFGTYLSTESLNSFSVKAIWSEYVSFAKENGIPVLTNDVKEIREKVKLLSANLAIESLDSAIQLSAILRRDFDRSDLAYKVMQPWLKGDHINSPHFNSTLLPILLDENKHSEADQAAIRLMTYSPKVDGALKFALPTYASYLMSLFEKMGDLDLLSEVETILAVMPSSEVEPSYYKHCLSRFYKIVGNKELAQAVYAEADGEARETIRNLSPSASKFLTKSKVGQEFADWLNESFSGQADDSL